MVTTGITQIDTLAYISIHKSIVNVRLYAHECTTLFCTILSKTLLYFMCYCVLGYITDHFSTGAVINIHKV